MKRNAELQAIALFIGAAFFVSNVELIAQSPQPRTSDKAQSSAATSNAAAAAKSTPAAPSAPSATSSAPAQAAVHDKAGDASGE